MMPEEIGLPPQAVESIRQVLGRFPGIEQAVLYGSRAKGNFRTGSDIDLTLKGRPELSRFAEYRTGAG